MAAWAPLKLHRTPGGRERLFVQHTVTRRIRHQPASSLSSHALASLPVYNENPKYLTHFEQQRRMEVARYAQLGDVVYCGGVDFGEVTAERAMSGVPFLQVELRNGGTRWFELRTLRVLDNNFVGRSLSAEERELLNSNRMGLLTLAEVDQAVDLARPAAEFFIGKQSTLGSGHVLMAHEILFGRVFPWAGQLRTQPVTVGRVNYPTPEPTQLPQEMRTFDQFLRSLQTRLATQNPSLNRASIWRNMARVYFELCRIHPFRDGNGRLSRMLVEAILSNTSGGPVRLDWDGISRVSAKTRWAFRRARDLKDLRPLATWLFKAHRKASQARTGQFPSCPNGLRKDLC